MDCTLQIFLDDRWVDCAQIELNSGLCQWNYLVEYAVERPDAPVSLAEPVDMEIRPARTMPAFLYDLVPQGAGRRFLLGELKLPDGPDANFPLIRAGAFNPIGRMRVAEAVDYFDEHVARHPAARGLHGPLALVTDAMPVVTVAPNDALLEKLKSNIQEVRARGGQLYVFADADTKIVNDEGLHVIRMPEHYGLLSPILHVVPLQMLAYHTACARGTDVDKPRNLAKSVTVE